MAFTIICDDCDEEITPIKVENTQYIHTVTFMHECDDYDNEDGESDDED